MGSQAIRVVRMVAFAWIAAAGPGRLDAIELHRATLAAWDAYIRQTDAGMQARLDGRRPFLWMDETPGRARRLRRGQILVEPADGRGVFHVPDGLIHHWIGAAFIPHVTLSTVGAVIHDYARYKDIFKPVVADSKLLACAETGPQFSMIWQHRVLFVTAAVQADYQARDVAVSARRGYDIVSTTRMREIQNYGETGARLLPPDQGSGFLWRLHSIVRYDERDGGVYIELEAFALTRDIPDSLRWLLSPILSHLSNDSLTTTLRETRQAIDASARPVQTAARAGAE
jgi:hypothetical protein